MADGLKVVERFVELVNAGHYEEAVSLLRDVSAPDIEFRPVLGVAMDGRTFHGPEQASDYFRDLEHFEQSVSRHLQVTPYRPDYVATLPERFGLEFVGATDFGYRGDFVHNYSFVNLCMRKRAASTPAPAGDNGKAQL